MTEFANIMLIFPIIFPLLSGIILIFAWKHPGIQRGLNLFFASITVVAAFLLLLLVKDGEILSLTVGGWQSPYGISIVADIFSVLMVLISSVIYLSNSIYSLVAIDKNREKFFYYPLTQILMMGIYGSFLTGDLFNLYVWFEVMLISSFVLMALGGRQEQLEGALKYVVINLISSALFLAGVGLVYGTVGTLNMAELAKLVPMVEDIGLLNFISVMFLISFGIKSAIFPLFFWLPASYHTPPSPITSLLAGLLTKVGVYALFRTFTLIFTQDTEFTNTLLLVLAGFTMVTGVFGPLAQMDFRRILSFHIVSQVGYMVMGLALYTPLAIAGGVFYMVHHMIVKTNLFVISGVVKRIKGSYHLDEAGGVFKQFPFLSILFLISALSLAGIPPLSGFWGKLILTKAGFEINQFYIIGVSLFVSLLTLFSMSKIWNYVFWKDDPKEDNEITREFMLKPVAERYLHYTPIIILASVTVFVGLNAELIFDLSTKAAEQLTNPEIYIKAVLGEPK